jgi:hypothetical protein
MNKKNTPVRKTTMKNMYILALVLLVGTASLTAQTRLQLNNTAHGGGFGASFIILPPLTPTTGTVELRFPSTSGTALIQDNSGSTSLQTLNASGPATFNSQLTIQHNPVNDSSTYTLGLSFANNPYGGTADKAGLRLYNRNATEDMVMEFYIGNDNTDIINFAVSDNNNGVRVNDHPVITTQNASTLLASSLAGAYWALGGNTLGAVNRLGSNDNFAIAFETNNLERVRILNTGEVGIGTDLPTQLLDVNGTTNIRDHIFLRKNAFFYDGIVGYLGGSITGVEPGGVSGDSTKLGLYGGRGNGGIVLYTNVGNTQTEVMRLTSNPNNLIGGRVSIRAGSSPSALVSIGGGAGGNLTIDDSGNLVTVGDITVGGGASASELRFLEPSGSGTNYTAFKAGVQIADLTYTLPTTGGTAGQVLSTNGSGTLSWETTITPAATTIYTATTPVVTYDANNIDLAVFTSTYVKIAVPAPAAASTVTLPAGTDGQVVLIRFAFAAGTGTVTIRNQGGADTAMIYDGAGADSIVAHLLYTTEEKWVILSAQYFQNI